MRHHHCPRHLLCALLTCGVATERPQRRHERSRGATRWRQTLHARGTRLGVHSYNLRQALTCDDDRAPLVAQLFSSLRRHRGPAAVAIDWLSFGQLTLASDAWLLDRRRISWHRRAQGRDSRNCFTNGNRVAKMKGSRSRRRRLPPAQPVHQDMLGEQAHEHHSGTCLPPKVRTCVMTSTL